MFVLLQPHPFEPIPHKNLLMTKPFSKLYRPSFLDTPICYLPNNKERSVQLWKTICLVFLFIPCVCHMFRMQNYMVHVTIYWFCLENRTGYYDCLMYLNYNEMKQCKEFKILMPRQLVSKSIPEPFANIEFWSFANFAYYVNFAGNKNVAQFFCCKTSI